MDATDDAQPMLPDADESPDDAESRDQNESRSSLVSPVSARTQKSDAAVSQKQQDNNSLRQASEEENEDNKDQDEEVDKIDEHARSENGDAPDPEENQPNNADGNESEKINVADTLEDAVEDNSNESKDKELSNEDEETPYEAAAYADDFISETERGLELDRQRDGDGDDAETEGTEAAPTDDMSASKNSGYVNNNADYDYSEDESNESEDSEDSDDSEEQSEEEAAESANDGERSDKENQVTVSEQMDTDAEATNTSETEANNYNQDENDSAPNIQEAEQNEENNADNTSVTKRAPRVHFSLTTAIEVERPDDGEATELQSEAVSEQTESAADDQPLENGAENEQEQPENETVAEDESNPGLEINEQMDSAADDQVIENEAENEQEQPENETTDANQEADDESKPGLEMNQPIESVADDQNEAENQEEQPEDVTAVANKETEDESKASLENSTGELDGIVEEAAASQLDITNDEREADVAVVVDAETEQETVEGEQSQPIETSPDENGTVTVEIDSDQNAATGDHVVVDMDGVLQSDMDMNIKSEAVDIDPQVEIESAAPPANDKAAKASDGKSARPLSSAPKREEPLLRKVSLKRITSANGMSQQAQANGRGRPTTARVKPTAPMVTQLSNSSAGSIRPKSAITAVKKPNPIAPPTRKISDNQKKKEKIDGKDEPEKKPQKASTQQKTQASLQTGIRQKSASKLTKRQTSTAIKTAVTPATNGKPSAEQLAAGALKNQPSDGDATANPNTDEQPQKDAENAKVTTPSKTDPVQRSDSVNLLKAPNLNSKDALARDSDDESTAKQGKDQSHSLNADSMTYNAIPYLPVGCAVLCLILNIFLPGVGTVLAGFASLCCGQMRTHSKEPDEARFNTVCVNFWVGISQLVTVTLLLVGWFWSVAWGIHIMALSLEHRKRAIKKAEKAQRQQARSRLSLPA